MSDLSQGDSWHGGGFEGTMYVPIQFCHAQWMEESEGVIASTIFMHMTLDVLFRVLKRWKETNRVREIQGFTHWN